MNRALPHVSAAAWDAPLTLDRPGVFGSGDIFATQRNFETYPVTRLLQQRGAALRDGDGPRLILLGYANFRGHHQAIHYLLDVLGIAHVYHDGPRRAHCWESGWVPEAARALLEGEPAG